MEDQLINLLLNADTPTIAVFLYLLYRLETMNLKLNNLERRLSCVENENSTRPTIPIPVSQENQ